MNSENFVIAVVNYHRAMATFRYEDALKHARIAVESAPCDSEATNWASEVVRLENKTAKGVDKILRLMGFKAAKI